MYTFIHSFVMGWQMFITRIPGNHKKLIPTWMLNIAWKLMDSGFKAAQSKKETRKKNDEPL